MYIVHIYALEYVWQHWKELGFNNGSQHKLQFKSFSLLHKMYKDTDKNPKLFVVLNVHFAVVMSMNNDTAAITYIY